MTHISRVVCTALLLSGFVSAQQSTPPPNLDEYIKAARTDIRAQKSQLLGAALALSSGESAAFWPVYQTYEKALEKIGDDRYALIKDYAANYTKLTDAKAVELTDRALALEEQRLALIKQYLPQIRKVLPPAKAARWYQTEMGLNKIIDLQIAAEIPLAK